MLTFEVILAAVTISLLIGMSISEYKVAAERLLNSYLDEAIQIKKSHVDLLQR